MAEEAEEARQATRCMPTRRGLVKAAAMGLVGSCLPFRKEAAPWFDDGVGVAPSPFMVDTHAHIFNASDLPTNGFINLVQGRGLLGKLGWRLGGVLKLVQDEIAPGFGEENRRLDELLSQSPAVRDLSDSAGRGDNRLAQELSSVEDPGMKNWVKLMSRYRFQIAQQLIETYASDVSLFVPSLVDMGGWLKDRPRTSIWNQILLGEKMSRLFEGKVLPFAAFDPCRYVYDRAAMFEVQEAVEKRGFVGVKLYNPMGFKPIGNRDLRLDNALLELYEWCSLEEVPLLVHSRKSNGAGIGAAKKASPHIWERVLHEFPNLRISFGHFGGADRFIKKRGESWGWKISQLLLEYEGAYAGTGFHRFALGDGDPRRAEMFLSALADVGSGAAKANRASASDGIFGKTLYGSDWHMIFVKGEHDGYASNYRGFVESFLKQSFSAEDATQILRDFCHRNALRFLGLDSPERKARLRLVRFFRKYPENFAQPPSWWVDEWELRQ